MFTPTSQHTHYLTETSAFFFKQFVSAICFYQALPIKPREGLKMNGTLIKAAFGGAALLALGVDSQTKCDTGYVRSRHGKELQPPQP